MKCNNHISDVPLYEGDTKEKLMFSLKFFLNNFMYSNESNVLYFLVGATIIMDLHFSSEPYIVWDCIWHISSCVFFIRLRNSTSKKFWKYYEYCTKMELRFRMLIVDTKNFIPFLDIFKYYSKSCSCFPFIENWFCGKKLKFLLLFIIHRQMGR